MSDDYARGEMDTSEHSRTFSGFIDRSIFSSLLLGVTIFFLALVFAASLDWIGALIICALVGVLGGFALKRGAAYYSTLAFLGVLTAVIALVVNAMA